MPTFEIDDPEIDVEALEQRVRSAIEAKRGVRFSDEELQELRDMRLRPRLRRDDLPRGWLAEMPEARSHLPRVSAPPSAELSIEPAAELYKTGATGLRGVVLRLLRRLARPIYGATSNLDWVLSKISGELAERISDQGSWTGEHLSAMTGQLERWRERDLHLYHNLVYEITTLWLNDRHMQDRINELTRRLDMLAEREGALERLTVGEGNGPEAGEGR